MKTKKFLHNRVDKKILQQKLAEEPFPRVTLSFYRYVIINDPNEFRNQLFRQWDNWHCFGRIYIAHEGINAQMSVPLQFKDAFLKHLDSVTELKNMPIKWAVEDDGKSFYKLTIKVREKIVADGLDDNSFDVTNVGNHLTALEFHELVDKPDVTVIDMRNHYESEIGRFVNAYCPDADTFKEELQLVLDELKDKKDQKVLMYCTGGVRCEKASAYLKHHGFTDVSQLHGGIIEYVRQIRQQGVTSKFLGKNFVFDQRMGERVTDDVLSLCHQCGTACDTHTNCANQDCHVLFIQCSACAAKYEGCCSNDCQSFMHLPEEAKVQSGRKGTFLQQFNRLRPKINQVVKTA